MRYAVPWLKGHRALAFGLLMTMSFLLSAKAQACSCVADDRSMDQRIVDLTRDNDHIGIYRISGARHAKLNDNTNERSRRWFVLKPIRVLKGNHQTLLAPKSSALFKTTCDQKYRQGDLILVFAKSNQPVSLNFCSNSGRLESKFEEYEALIKQSSNRKP